MRSYFFDEFLSNECEKFFFFDLCDIPFSLVMPHWSLSFFFFFNPWGIDLFEDNALEESENYEPENLNDLHSFYDLFFNLEFLLRYRQYYLVFFFFPIVLVRYPLVRWVSFFFSLPLTVTRRIEFLVEFSHFFMWPFIFSEAFKRIFRRRFILSTKASVVNSIFFTTIFGRIHNNFLIFLTKNNSQQKDLHLLFPLGCSFSFKISFSSLVPLVGLLNSNISSENTSTVILNHSNFFLLKDSSKFEFFLFLLNSNVTFFFFEVLFSIFFFYIVQLWVKCFFILRTLFSFKYVS